MLVSSEQPILRNLLAGETLVSCLLQMILRHG